MIQFRTWPDTGAFFVVAYVAKNILVHKTTVDTVMLIHVRLSRSLLCIISKYRLFVTWR